MSPDKELQRKQNEDALLAKLPREPRVKLDGTLNINTLLAAGSLLVSGALAYATIDKRVSIVEQVQQDRIVRIEQELREVRAELKELTKALSIQKDRQ